jgi:hypothetical protein
MNGLARVDVYETTPLLGVHAIKLVLQEAPALKLDPDIQEMVRTI